MFNMENKDITTKDLQIIIQRLKDLGISQMEIAEEIGVKQPSISDISRGKSANPSYRVASGLINFAKKKGVCIDSKKRKTNRTGTDEERLRETSPARQPLSAVKMT